MNDKRLAERFEESVDASLVQLARGSGITPEQRRRMAKIIAGPLMVIVDDELSADE